MPLLNLLISKTRGATLLAVMLGAVSLPIASQADPRPDALPGGWPTRGDTHMRFLDAIDLKFGVQYRVMYDASNIPGPAGSTFQDTEDYDFMRQRFRMNFDVSPKNSRVGGFAQLEFRGGFGGSSPNASDPRGQAPTLNPFNRLQARGVRFGYVYWRPNDEVFTMAGILPLSDQFGDTLFSADWDWHVGGVALLGGNDDHRYRAAYMNLVEGLGDADPSVIGEDGHLGILDYVRNFDLRGDGTRDSKLGAHIYYLDIDDGLPIGNTWQLYAGTTFETEVAGTRIDGFALLNYGALGEGMLAANGSVVSGFTTRDKHLGVGLRLGASRELFEVEQGPVRLDTQLFYSTGDREGGQVKNRFVTPQALFGTQGYWAYTHLFTANGPSDTNDLAIELGNGGAGLLTLQGRLTVPLHPRLSVQAIVGYFRADRSRNGSQYLGTEGVLMFSFELGPGLVLDFGAAGADTGAFFGPDPDALYEGFVRLQLSI